MCNTDLSFFPQASCRKESRRKQEPSSDTPTPPPSLGTVDRGKWIFTQGQRPGGSLELPACFSPAHCEVLIWLFVHTKCPDWVFDPYDSTDQLARLSAASPSSGEGSVFCLRFRWSAVWRGIKNGTADISRSRSSSAFFPVSVPSRHRVLWSPSRWRTVASKTER